MGRDAIFTFVVILVIATVSYGWYDYKYGDGAKTEDISSEETKDDDGGFLGFITETRDDAYDTAIRATLNTTVKQMEIYISSELSYVGGCASPKVAKALTKIRDEYKNTSTTCNTSSSSFNISTILSSGEIYCVDHNLFTGVVERKPKGSSACK